MSSFLQSKIWVNNAKLSPIDIVIGISDAYKLIFNLLEGRFELTLFMQTVVIMRFMSLKTKIITKQMRKNSINQYPREIFQI